MTSHERPTGKARTLLLVAGAIVLVEALVFAVLAVLEAVNLSSERIGFGIGVTVFFVAIAAGLAWAARRIAVGDLGVRSPIVFAQLISLGLAWNFRADSAALAAAVAAPAVIVLICLLSPPVTRALTGENPV